MSKRGLGKGLDALLGNVKKTPAADTARHSEKLSLDKLVAGKFQPRRYFAENDLNTLADSIRQHGIIQPLVVRPLPGGKYEIVAGERRFRAARLAGVTSAPAVIRALSDKEAQVFALVENLQRADLNQIEQARGLAQLIDKTGITHAAAAAVVGLSRPAVSNLLRLLELSDSVQQYVFSGALEMGHARALLALPAAKRENAAKQVISRRLTTRQTEQFVRQLLYAGKRKQAETAKDSADTARLEKELAAKLAMRVEIMHRKDGSGQLILHYGSLTSLDQVLDKLKR